MPRNYFLTTFIKLILTALMLTSINLFAGFCTTADVKYNDPVEALYDNHWINDSTLQIQVEYTGDVNVPYTMRRDSSCEKARQGIDARLVSLYPTIKENQVRITIYKTVYYNKSDCRLIVHVSMPQLKRKLQKQ